MNELTTRQASLILFITSTAMKLLILPSLIISQTGNMVWLTFLIMFLIDGSFLLILLQVQKRHPSLTMNEFLERHFGKIFTKIFFAFIGILFAIKTTSLIRDLYEFYTETSYVDLSWIVFLFPTILLLIFVSSKRLRALGRSSEIFIYFIGISILIAILFAVPSGDYLRLLPMFSNGLSPVLKAGFDYSFWFGDFLILFLMCGKIEVKKNTGKIIFLTYLVSCLIVLFLVFSHYAIYGSISSMYKTSIVDITEYIPRLSTTGRFTWIIVFLWPIAVVFSLLTYTMMSVKSFEITFNVDESKSEIVSYCSIAISLAMLIFTKFSQVELCALISNYLKYFVVIVQYLLPLCFPVLLLIENKKESRKDVKKFMEK